MIFQEGEEEFVNEESRRNYWGQCAIPILSQMNQFGSILGLSSESINEATAYFTGIRRDIDYLVDKKVKANDVVLGAACILLTCRLRGLAISITDICVNCNVDLSSLTTLFKVVSDFFRLDIEPVEDSRYFERLVMTVKLPQSDLHRILDISNKLSILCRSESLFTGRSTLAFICAIFCVAVQTVVYPRTKVSVELRNGVEEISMFKTLKRSGYRPPKEALDYFSAVLNLSSSNAVAARMVEIWKIIKKYSKFLPFADVNISSHLIIYLEDVINQFDFLCFMSKYEAVASGEIIGPPSFVASAKESSETIEKSKRLLKCLDSSELDDEEIEDMDLENTRLILQGIDPGRISKRSKSALLAETAAVHFSTQAQRLIDSDDL